MIECSCKVVSNFKQHDPSTWNPQIEQCRRCAAMPRMIELLKKQHDRWPTLTSEGLLRELEVIE